MNYNDIEGKEKYVVSAYEADANRYSIKCQFLTMIFPFITWVLNCAGIFTVEGKLMFMSLLLSFVVTVLNVVVCSVLGMENKITKYCAMAGIVIAIFIQASLLTYHMYLLIVLPVIYSLQYGQRKMVYYTYILSIIGLAISVYVGYYDGLCDANMVVLTRGTIDEYVDITGTIFKAAPANSNPAWTLFIYFIIPRCMLLLAVLLMVIHISDTIASKAVNEEYLKHLSETDDMTKVYNRNKYLDMIRDYYPHIQEVSVIFWDVNGLKQTNDKIGHESGDILIKEIAAAIAGAVAEEGMVYRIGGDEFIMIIDNPSDEEGKNISASVAEMIEKANEGSSLKITSAVGIAKGYGRDVLEVVKRADEEMYKNKVKSKAGR